MHSALSTCSGFICSEYSCTKTKEYNITTWTDQNWTFSGFAIGPSSGDHYHLISNLAEQDCAILKETASGSIQWLKYYNLTPCQVIVIDSSETN